MTPAVRYPTWVLSLALLLAVLVGAPAASAEHDACVGDACLETRDQEEGEGSCSSSQASYQRTRGVYLTVQDGEGTYRLFVEEFCYHNTGSHGTNDGQRLVVTVDHHAPGEQRTGASVLWGEANHQPPDGGEPFEQCGVFVSVWPPGTPGLATHLPCPADQAPPQLLPSIP